MAVVLATVPSEALAAVVLTVDPSEVLTAVDLAVVPSVVVHTAVVLAVAVPSAEVHMAVHMVEVTAVHMVEVAEWADIAKSEHQFPDFRIRHPRNLAH